MPSQADNLCTENWRRTMLNLYCRPQLARVYYICLLILFGIGRCRGNRTFVNVDQMPPKAGFKRSHGCSCWQFWVKARFVEIERHITLVKTSETASLGCTSSTSKEKARENQGKGEKKWKQHAILQNCPTIPEQVLLLSPDVKKEIKRKRYLQCDGQAECSLA